MEKTTRKKRTNKNLTSRRSLVHWCPKKNKKFRTKKIMTRKAKKTKKRRKKRCWRRRSQKKDKNKHDRSVETKTTTLISFEGIFMTIEVGINLNRHSVPCHRSKCLDLDFLLSWT
jgi:hypothetical protein